MSQEMSLTSMLLNIGTGSTGNKYGTGYIKLPPLPKDENMFGIWKLKVESIIRGAGLIELLEFDEEELRENEVQRLNVYRKEREGKKEEELPDVEELTQEQKDLLSNKSYKVYAALADTLVTADQMRILLNKKNVPEGNAYSLWKAIKERYDIRTTDATKERLWEIFNGMKMSSGDDFKSYKGKVEEAVANLYTVEEEVPESRIKAKLITGLSTRYSAFVGALYTQDYSDMTMVDLCKKINDFEESTVFKSTSNESEGDYGFTSYANNDSRKGNQQKGGVNRAPKATNDKIKCYICHKVGHKASECYANKRSKKNCSRCKKIGHTDSECWFNKNNKKEEKDQSSEEYGNFFAPVIPSSSDVVINEDTWILDSGASKHLCTNKKLMSQIEKASEAIRMKCANKQTVELSEIGRVKLRILNGRKEAAVTLLNVAHAPTFQCNIISVGKLIDAGAKVVFGKRGAMVFAKDGKPVITAKRFGNLFVISIVNKSDNTHVVTEDMKSKAEQWHCRLGHIAYEGLKRMVLNKSVEGLNIEQVNEKTMRRCSSCLKGKQHRHPFNSEWKDKAENVMDRAHADLCGPVQSTREGQEYLSTIIDERSRMIFGDLLKYKSDAAEGIMKWCNSAKTLQGRTLVEFHSDGGGEYRGKKLLKYFADEGIRTTSTLPSTPQHNPIAERANRTIFESARTMLTHSGLPKEFWGDAVLYAIHIRNRCLTTADKQKSPYELWTGKKPSVSHIRVFGCDAFMHVKDSDRTKMDNKSIESIMIGYSDYYRGYKLYSIKNRKVYYSRDVVFDEQSFKHAMTISDNRNENKVGQPISDNYFKPLDEEEEKNAGIVNEFEGEEEPLDDSDINASEENKEATVEIEQKDEQTEIKESVEHDDEKQEERVDVSSLPREVRQLMADRQHAMFSPPRTRRRNATAADPGAVITDSRQIEEFSQPVIEENDEYCFMSSVVEPSSYTEAMNSVDADKWKEATEKEYKSLIDNHTWEKCKLPPDRVPIGCKWVYKVKINKNGEIERYKARLVAKGYSQKEGIDYNETFAPVLKYKSLRILLSLAAIKDMEVKQMDVETAFLNAPIKEEVYMEQPEGYHDGNNQNVLRLLKTLYGTKQAPHEWNNTLNDFIVSLNFTRCLTDTCTYVRRSRTNKPMIIGIFVDDIIILYDKADESEWFEYKKGFMKTFKMKDLNDAEWILGIRITRDRIQRTIKLDHEVQINKTLKTFHMSECNPTSTPTEVRKVTKADCPTTQQERQEMSKIPYKSLIGALQYIALSTRPDIAYAVNQLSRFLSDPGNQHWLGGKRVLRYLKGTAKMSLLYKDYDKTQSTKIEAFCDADWAGDLDDRKSTTGIIVKLNGCPVLWLSKKQSTVALSTAEAEYIAIATVAQEVIWINQYLTELGMKDPETPILRSDNQAAIQITNNDTLHSRTKHIDIRYHFIRQVVKQGGVKLTYINTKEQEADINTKGLTVSTYKHLRDKLLTEA
jgi:hypothetical protein